MWEDVDRQGVVGGEWKGLNVQTVFTVCMNVFTAVAPGPRRESGTQWSRLLCPAASVSFSLSPPAALSGLTSWNPVSPSSTCPGYHPPLLSPLRPLSASGSSATLADPLQPGRHPHHSHERAPPNVTTPPARRIWAASSSAASPTRDGASFPSPTSLSSPASQSSLPPSRSPPWAPPAHPLNK